VGEHYTHDAPTHGRFDSVTTTYRRELPRLPDAFIARTRRVCTNSAWCGVPEYIPHSRTLQALAPTLGGLFRSPNDGHVADSERWTAVLRIRAAAPADVCVATRTFCPHRPPPLELEQ